MSNTSSDEQLRSELHALGAREFEQVALGMDSDRGLAALKIAVERGAEHPIPYAIKLFDDSAWTPTGEFRRRVTNTHAEVDCKVCAGHRMVPVTDDWSAQYGETWAPCAACTGECNTTFYRVDGTRVVSVAR